jgi:isoleucyl-tRNA synthetase
VSLHGDRVLPPELVAEIAEELNVREVMPLSAAGEVVDITVRANFRELGKRFGKKTQSVATAVLARDHDELVSVLKSGGTVRVAVDGEQVEIGLGDVTFSEVPRSGWAVSTQADLTVALDTEITPELRLAGLAREFIRLVQAARKDAGFDVADRVLLSWAASGEVADAIRAHAAQARVAVLAVGGQEYPLDAVPDSAAGSATGVLTGEELDVRFWLDRAPA